MMSRAIPSRLPPLRSTDQCQSAPEGKKSRNACSPRIVGGWPDQRPPSVRTSSHQTGPSKNRRSMKVSRALTELRFHRNATGLSPAPLKEVANSCQSAVVLTYTRSVDTKDLLCALNRSTLQLTRS